MSTVDTDLQQLVINVGTTAEIEAAISGGTITQDMLSITTDGADYADVNLSNLTATGKSSVAWFGMPSSDYIDITAGASETSYTAPANGYFDIIFNSTSSGGYFGIRREATSISSMNSNIGSNMTAVCELPYGKGRVMTVFYGGGNINIRFRYAEGEK